MTGWKACPLTFYIFVSHYPTFAASFSVIPTGAAFFSPRSGGINAKRFAWKWQSRNESLRVTFGMTGLGTRMHKLQMTGWKVYSHDDIKSPRVGYLLVYGVARNQDDNFRILVLDNGLAPQA